MNISFRAKFGVFYRHAAINFSALRSLSIEGLYQFLLKSFDVTLGRQYILKVRDTEGASHKLSDADDLARLYELTIVTQTIDVSIHAVEGFFYDFNKSVFKTRSDRPYGLFRNENKVFIDCDEFGYSTDAENELSSIREPTMQAPLTIDQRMESFAYEEKLKQFKVKFDTLEKLQGLEKSMRVYNTLKAALEDDLEDKDEELIKTFRSLRSNLKRHNVYVKLVPNRANDTNHSMCTIWNNTTEEIPAHSRISLKHIQDGTSIENTYDIGPEPIRQNEIQMIIAYDFKVLKSQVNSHLSARLYDPIPGSNVISEGTGIHAELIKLEKILPVYDDFQQELSQYAFVEDLEGSQGSDSIIYLPLEAQ